MFSGLESPAHLIIVLVIAMLVLGPKRLPQVGRSLGSGIRHFKASLEGKDEHEADQVDDQARPDEPSKPSVSVNALPETEVKEQSPPRTP
jgi:sec-independent protein translocase protein TatA